VLSKAGLLPAAVVAQAKELRHQLKDKFMEMSVGASEYNAPAQNSLDVNPENDINEIFPEQATPANADNNGFEEAPPLPDDNDLPF